MQVTQRKRTSASAYRAKKLLRTKHLNEEEKRALKQICEEFCDTFYLENYVNLYVDRIT